METAVCCPSKLSGAFDMRRQQWRTVRFQPNPQQNEKVMARDLAAEMPAGTLLVADLGYFGFAWFDWLTDRGYHWLSRLRVKTSYKVMHVFYERGEVFDGIVWLGAYRADRAKHAVRLVTFRQGMNHAPLYHQQFTTLIRSRFHPWPRSMLEGGISRWRSNWSSSQTRRLLWSAKQVVDSGSRYGQRS